MHSATVESKKQQEGREEASQAKHEQEAVHEKPQADSPAAPSSMQTITPVIFSSSSTPEVASSTKSQSLQQIEDILSEDLGEVYASLSPKEQFIIKTKGEQTAEKIREVLRQATLQFRTLFKLILSWLRVIPGVARPFVEQEAKIKADKLLRLRSKKDL
ncbi:MAG: hypothetical protein WC817_02640 [Patescibacteria group bacterium]|jgi:hypothetical protein